tara:strand:+ start:1359 stop:1955 length:597 start_codon:yes stop_codon:yes gene_type:complete
MIKKLYDRCLELARHKFSKPALAFISFVESSFFPIPPDIMIIPMSIAKKEDYFKNFLIATLFSVLGGVFGYFLGNFFIELSMSVIEFYNYEEKVLKLQEELSNRSGKFLWLGALFLAGFTPVPYKVFTITSGMINFNLTLFILVSLISRGLRFFIVSYLSMKFGKKFEEFFFLRGGKTFLIFGFLIILILSLIYIWIS